MSDRLSTDKGWKEETMSEKEKKIQEALKEHRAEYEAQVKKATKRFDLIEKQIRWAFGKGEE